jgi:hypothetical protein
MKSVEVTLYDIFGYLLPGTVASLGLYLIMRPVLTPIEPQWVTLSTAKWVALAVGAYLAGHFVQGIANQVDRLLRLDASRSVLVQDHSLAPLVEAAKAKARRIAGLGDSVSIDSRTLFNIMDHYVQQYGKTATRDIYVYREGFYRGLCTAFFLLSVGCFLRALGDQAHLSLFQGHLFATASLMWQTGALAIVLMVLTHLRHRRFSRYIVKNALFSFVCLTKPAE